VAALAASERGGARERFARRDDFSAAPKLVPPRVVVRQRPLLVRRQPVRAETLLRKPA
jgi:hypothetical protein